MNDTELLRPLVLLFAENQFLKTDWADFLGESDETKKLPYIVAGSIGGAVVSALQQGRALHDFSAALEPLWDLASGRQTNLLVVGLLESIQNQLSSKPDQYAAVAAQLLPQTRFQWDDLDRYWRKG